MRTLNLYISFNSVGVLVLSVFLISPIFALVLLSFGYSDGLWPHLVNSVLGKYISNTVLLMLGVGLLSLIFGVSSAWILSCFRFRFSHWLDILILLPMACPAYLVAYAYTDVFEYAGPVQKILRQSMGWESASEYYFPEIRSMGGAIFVLSSVLYPYVYLLSRTAFQKIPSSFYEVATLSKKNLFWTVCFPLARPAIVAGTALVLMEVVSDFGTVEFFAIETLTLGIFNVWIGMDSIVGAAQIATVTFAIIMLLLLLEFFGRGDRRFNDTSRSQTLRAPVNVKGKTASILASICLIPVFTGFFIPVSIIAVNVFTSKDLIAFSDVGIVLSNSILVALVGTILIILSSLFMASSAKFSKGKGIQIIGNLSAAGYAFPGIMLAIGVLAALSFTDRALQWTSLYLSGTLYALFFAYLVRFQAIGYGAISSGLTKIPNNLFNCSRTLGLNTSLTMRRVTVPLLRSSILAAFVLTFVDIIKELPMTLLLRPFDFETLATYAYQFAHSELMDQASLPALMIISVGLVPVILLNKLTKINKF